MTRITTKLNMAISVLKGWRYNTICILLLFSMAANKPSNVVECTDKTFRKIIMYFISTNSKYKRQYLKYKYSFKNSD